MQTGSCLHSSARLLAQGCSLCSQGTASPALSRMGQTLPSCTTNPPEAQTSSSLVLCPHHTDESGTTKLATSYSHKDTALGTSSSTQGGSACAVPSLTSQCQTVQLVQAWCFSTVPQPPMAASSRFCLTAWPQGHCPGPSTNPIPAGREASRTQHWGEKDAPGPAGCYGLVGRSPHCAHPQSRAP